MVTVAGGGAAAWPWSPVRLDVKAAGAAQLGPTVGPVDPVLVGDPAQRDLDTFLEPAQAADVDAGPLAAQHLGQEIRPLVEAILDVLPLAAAAARIDQLTMQLRLQVFLQRAEVRQLLGRAGAVEKEQPSARLREGASSPVGEAAERRDAGAGADHQEIGLGIVGIRR